MPFDAVLFDFDGLILDTETPDYESWREVFFAHGCELPMQVWARAVGVPAGALNECAYLEEQLGRPVDHAAVRAGRAARFHDMVAGQPLRAGVLAALADARQLGLRVGIGSSADRAWIEGHLRNHGILDRFEVIRCVDDVQRAKPDPEVYLAAADALGIAATRTLVLEDSPNGIAAAKRAGMTCVAVPNPVTVHLDTSAADLVIESLEKIPLPALLEALGAA